MALLAMSAAIGSTGTSGAATTGASVSTGGVFVERTPWGMGEIRVPVGRLE